MCRTICLPALAAMLVFCSWARAWESSPEEVAFISNSELRYETPHTDWAAPYAGGRLNNKVEALMAGGGWVMVLQDGKARGSTEGLHPRTAVGIDLEHERMILMVVDGRREGVSEGMTENEVGVFLKELGCRFGVNLDGGSSSMLIPDEAGALTTVNMPSDGTPRPVPVLFGVAPAGNLDRKKED